MTDLTNISGRINSIQTLGTLDGPGVRFIIFFQGCPLRCGCCHNPDTWQIDAGTVMTGGELIDKILNYREYFGKDGGVTISGGEALLQPQFARAIFALCKENSLHTCLDTSGCLLNDDIKALLDLTDLVLLDIKYTDNKSYEKYVGCTLQKPLDFLEFLEQKRIETWIRQVVIPGKNNSEDNLKRLAGISNRYSCVKKTELLGFKKLCSAKYDNLNLDFPFADVPEVRPEELSIFQARLDQLLKQFGRTQFAPTL